MLIFKYYIMDKNVRGETWKVKGKNKTFATD